MRKPDRYLIFALLLSIPLTVVSCACVLSTQFGGRTSEIESVEAVTCRDINESGPISVTQVFTNPEQVCVYVRVRMAEDLPTYGTVTPLPLWTFVEYTGGEEVGRFSVWPEYLPDERLLAGGICKESPLAKGKHQWGIELGTVEITRVDFEVR